MSLPLNFGLGICLALAQQDVSGHDERRGLQHTWANGRVLLCFCVHLEKDHEGLQPFQGGPQSEAIEQSHHSRHVAYSRASLTQTPEGNWMLVVECRWDYAVCCCVVVLWHSMTNRAICRIRGSSRPSVAGFLGWSVPVLCHHLHDAQWHRPRPSLLTLHVAVYFIASAYLHITFSLNFSMSRAP